MSKYNCTMILQIFNYLQCRECFTKAHLGIPKHAHVSSLKPFLSFINCLFLLRSKFYRRFVCRDFKETQSCTSTFNCSNTILYGFKVSLKPFICTVLRIKVLSLNARINQNLMYLFIIEGTDTRSIEIGSTLSI